MPSGEEIQQALRGFVDRWSGYAGSERAEAQTFLNELFACYGSDRRQVGARFEDFVYSAGFLDLHWPGVCIVEMKAPVHELDAAQIQVDRYWRESADYDAKVPAARFVIKCNFREFEIWEPGQYPTRPVLGRFPLSELPDRYDAFAFLTGPNIEPTFTEHHRELTKDAARLVSEVYHSLLDRVAAPPREIQRFTLQSVWCMFAEDLGLLDGYPFEQTLRSVRADPPRSLPDLSLLFRVLNQKSPHNRKGRLAGTTYVNGELFAEPAEVELQREEIDLLIRASEFDWRHVDPTIFGSLLEGVLGHDQRWRRGAHYTHEVDILKIVSPTIVRPWRERIGAAETPRQARDLLEELCRFRVLDPACGCGNFLYVAYRELRGLEAEVKARIRTLSHETGLPVPAGPEPYYPMRNLQGIDIEPSAVRLARVTLWMGHRQMIDQYGEAEPPLPLQDLSSIREGDALRVSWPDTDCIIGNPPFMGAKLIRPNLGDGYADWLSSTFRVGVKDLCVYWFRRTVEHLADGQRAGLVGTNSISQTGGRSASLAFVAAEGGVITDAFSSQRWPGDAKVHVSIVNWIAHPDAPVDQFTLDGLPVDGITTQLRAGTPAQHEPATLPANAGRCFAGVVPQAKGFLLGRDEAEGLLADPDRDYSVVIPQFLTGDDLVSRPKQDASRRIIDFDSRPLEEAMTFPRALQVVRDRVQPEREASPNRAVERRWWLFGRRVPAMREAIRGLPRYIAGGSTGKRLTLAWQPASVLPNNAVACLPSPTTLRWAHCCLGLMAPGLPRTPQPSKPGCGTHQLRSS